VEKIYGEICCLCQALCLLEIYSDFILFWGYQTCIPLLFTSVLDSIINSLSILAAPQSEPEI